MSTIWHLKILILGSYFLNLKSEILNFSPIFHRPRKAYV